MSIEHVILLSTGAGLSGSLSVLDRVLHNADDTEDSSNNKQALMKSVHLYDGVRTVDELPYQDLLHKRTEEHREFELIIVESHERNENMKLLKEGIRRAVAIGNEAKTRILESTTKNQLGKIYVQHVLQDSLADQSFSVGALEKTVFVVCGRLASLEDSKAMLERTLCSSGGEAGGRRRRGIQQ